MLSLNAFRKITDFEWELPKSYRSDMRVPVRIFTSEQLLELALKDKALQQAVNVSTLPGLIGWVAVMPDVHQGYGFPIGGVAASSMKDGIISPGGIGYDINCGVRLMASRIHQEAARELLPELASLLNRLCPSGVGVKGAMKLSVQELDAVCRQGTAWALKKGWATRQDLQRTEDQGCLAGADPGKVSPRAKERGRSQLGSLGAGNHFIEVDVVDEVFNPEAASIMGLEKGCLAVQVHTGSRGFGHQICTDYVRAFQSAVYKYHIQIPDRELVCAPIESREGQDYLAAMRAAANFAFVNRQMIANAVREGFEITFGGRVDNWQLTQVYDITHNIGKVETHNVDGVAYQVCVHRKGATRAFGPGADGLPGVYAQVGQPVLVPGSMGTHSWVLTGSQGSMARSFGSCCHGAGRVMSRSQAKKKVWGEDLKRRLQRAGIEIRAGSMAGLAEEAPEAYKDVDQVIMSVIGAGLASRVARLKPLIVIKG